MIHQNRQAVLTCSRSGWCCGALHRAAVSPAAKNFAEYIDTAVHEPSMHGWGSQ